MALTTLTNVKAYRGITDTSQDAELQRILLAAEQFCRTYCRRVFDGNTGLVEFRSGRSGQTRLLVRQPPINSIASIYDDPDRAYGSGTLIASTDYAIADADAGLIVFDGVSLQEGVQNVKLTYSGGFIPPTAPAAPTVTPVGTAGSTAYSYQVTALTAQGESAASTAGSTSTGNATLSATNLNRVTWAAVAGATGYRISRSVAGGTSPTTTGLIVQVYAGSTLTFDDTGLAGDGVAASSLVRTGVPPDLNQAAIELVWLAREKGAVNLLGKRSQGIGDGTFTALDMNWPAHLAGILDAYRLPDMEW